MTHEMTTRVNTHVCGYISWFVPEKVSFNAMPRAFTLITCIVQYFCKKHTTREDKCTLYQENTYRDGTNKRANTYIDHDVCLPIKWDKPINKYDSYTDYHCCITHEG
jgi:hypothetical protein